MNDKAKPTADLRLGPEMASFRLLVLKFVRDYIGRWGQSPSYGEIANSLHTNRTRIRKAIKSLVAEGMLLNAPGPRGLTMPTAPDDAVRVLRALGWDVEVEGKRLRPPNAPPSVTHRPLLPPAALDYIERSSAGDRHAKGEARRGQGG
jgi:hypothetical protein